MSQITVPSFLISPRTTHPLTPAMLAAVWEIASVLDEQRIPLQVDDPVWLEIPSKRLRGPGAQPDNRWLRECLKRLREMTFTGEHRGNAWGAGIIGEWEIVQGGTVTRVSIPTAAVRLLHSRETFARIETYAAHRLSAHARRLYAILADKKRMGRPSWTFQLAELKALLGVDNRRSYDRWSNFRQWVLEPAVAAINAFGTVQVTMRPQKSGRAVEAVRFDWRWKTPDEARMTTEESERVHPFAEQPAVGSAPPLLPERRAERELNERKWWDELPQDERDRLIDEIRARPFEPFPGLDGEVLLAELPERFVIRIAWEEGHPEELPYDELPED